MSFLSKTPKLTPKEHDAILRAALKEKQDVKRNCIQHAVNLAKYGNKTYISFSFGSASDNTEIYAHDIDDIMEHFKEYNIINISTSTNSDYRTNHTIWMVKKTEDQRFLENI